MEVISIAQNGSENKQEQIYKACCFRYSVLNLHFIGQSKADFCNFQLLKRLNITAIP